MHALEVEWLKLLMGILTCFELSAMFTAWPRSCSVVSTLEVRARVKRHRIHRASLSMLLLSCCHVRFIICWRVAITTGDHVNSDTFPSGVAHRHLGLRKTV